MADQRNPAEVSEMQKADHVGDVRMEPNLRTNQMRALT